eukprot:CAMPEP_0175097324 /NCGR_PEP_ID=MMETSP0086_2-20121207/5224_1 /TAXON_ID=136419 /ORGANISM="Unknown Unknown, Strain D1" /LENGTH=256 /DNA_ID=CAMNT_0016370823 /DNA_START=142 /DNA_END=912 /DNA_ORIENTATION=+
MPPVASEIEHKSEEDFVSNCSALKYNDAESTVIFLDWDDTLLCSSFLSSEGFRLDSDMSDANQDMMAQLKELETCVINVIKLAVTFGDVHVVTNAETGWVQLSAQKFLPGVVPMLSKVKILSARSTYENHFPDSPLKWKYYAFQERLSQAFADSDRPKNILSFGDSHVEREAVRAVTRGVPNTRTKSIKFAERPSIEQLQRQIELVTNCFQYILNHEGDLDLCMSLSVTPNQSAEEHQNQAQMETGKEAAVAPVPC